MFKPREFKLKASEIQRLVDARLGAGIASDHITVNGELVGFMYREEPDNAVDSGWRFMSGNESQEYIDDPDNLAFYELNTIANYDPAIIPYLSSPIGTQLERIEGEKRFAIAK